MTPTLTLMHLRMTNGLDYEDFEEKLSFKFTIGETIISPRGRHYIVKTVAYDLEDKCFHVIAHEA